MSIVERSPFNARVTGIVVLAIAAALVVPFFVSQSNLYLFTLAFLYGIAALGVIIPIGYSGQVIIAQGAFLGIGAYTYVKLSAAGVPTWGAVVAGTVLATAVAWGLGRSGIRAEGIYLGILTIVFNELFTALLSLFPHFLGGSTGFPAPPLYLPSFLTSAGMRSETYYWLAVGAYLCALVITLRMLSSETGWAFLSVKDDPLAARSVGIDTKRYRLRAFAYTGALCGFAGTIFAPVVGYISPGSFNLSATVDILLAGVIGGVMSPIATILGSFVVVFLPQVLRAFSDLRLMIYMILLVLIFIFLPQGISGLVSTYLPGIRRWLR